MEGIQPLETLFETNEKNSGDVSGLNEQDFEDEIYSLNGYDFNKKSLLKCLQVNIDDSLPESHRTYLRAAKNALKCGERLHGRQLEQLGIYMKYFPSCSS